MTSWFGRTQQGIQSAPTSAVPFSAGPSPAQNYSRSKRWQDPNAPDVRLDVETRCVYERRLPGNAYISAHINRLQKGYYDSPLTSGDTIENVRFIALNFAFHPYENGNRFTSAMVSISLHDDTDGRYSDPHAGHKHYPQIPVTKPKFLRFAPHLIYGSVSPENLNFNFQIAGSLGVSQAPASASLNPSADWKSSYKLFQMMKIQGSTRVMRGWHPHEYEIEDGEVYWTMEENPLQRSGLPREFTFIMMMSKGDVENVVLDVHVEPKIASWFGHYPAWWNNQLKYQPIRHGTIDLNQELGQMFEPRDKVRGFNFANLAGSFNDFVALPGTTFSTKEQQYSNAEGSSSDDHDSGGDKKKGAASASAKPAALARKTSSKSTHHERDIEKPAIPQPTGGPNSGVLNIYLTNPQNVNLTATSPSPAPSSRSAHSRSVSHSVSRSPAPYQARAASQRPHPHLVTRGITSPPPEVQQIKQLTPETSTRSPVEPMLVASGPVQFQQPQPQSTSQAPRVRAPLNGPPTPQSLPKRRSINIVGAPRQSSLRRSRSKNDLRSSSPITEEHESPPRPSPYAQVTTNDDHDNLFEYISAPSSPGTSTRSRSLRRSPAPVLQSVQQVQPSPASQAAQRRTEPPHQTDRSSYARRANSHREPSIDDWPFDYRNGHELDVKPDRSTSRTPRNRDSPSPLRERRGVGGPINGVSNRTKRYSMPGYLPSQGTS
ncbi:hypothetical protein LTR66_015286 [Elasticomyces elasticus]|nr:hypothetical protein LTR66_015286 [Elasticomyces elasticus]